MRPLLIAVLVAAAVLAAAAGGVRWWKARQQQAAQLAAAAEQKRLSAVPAFLRLQGKVEARQVVNVASPGEGVVDQFLVEVGQDVAEGQPLAQIRNEGLESERTAAQTEVERLQTRVNTLEAAITAARLEASRAAADASRVKDEAERAEKAYRRQELLLREGATPRMVADKAQRDHATAQEELATRQKMARQADDRVSLVTRDLDAAKKLLEDKQQALEQVSTELAGTEVRSPVDGVLVARRVEPGGEVSRAMEDFIQIAVDITNLQALVELSAADAKRVQPGQPAQVRIVELGPTPLQGTIREVKESQAWVDFSSPSPAVRPGLAVQVEIPLSTPPR